MAEDYEYPSRYEIQQTLEEFCKRWFLDEFAQSRGVFITNVTQENLAEFLSSLFFDNEDLEQIRKAALQIHTQNTLSGFQVTSPEEGLDLVSLLDQERGTIVDAKSQMKLKNIIEKQENNKTVYHGTIEYQQIKPGRVQFLQGSERSFDFYIHKVSEGNWQILVDCSRSNDSRLMENWIRKQAPRETELRIINQDKLTTSQTIQFFDELGKRGEGSDWTFTQVKRIVLRKETNSGEEDEERVETETSVLSGITQAILEGNELRNNPFVKQSEEGGYRFTAMTYQYEHKRQPFTKKIRAEFKKKPKVFEVALENYSRRTGLEERLEGEKLTSSERIQLLSQFWQQAKTLFEELQVKGSS